MTQTQKTSISIVLTSGLLAAVLIHAIALSTAQRAMPRLEQAIFGDSIADIYQKGGINFDAQRMSDRPMNALPVNPMARDEIKRQISGTPFNGQMNGVRYVNGLPCNTCPTPNNAPPKPIAGTPIAKPVTPKYSLSLFVIAGDAKSQQLTNWFATDPRLNKLASNCNYQIYTRDNPLYKARFSSLVPAETFPAVLFQDPTGGHVHASNGAAVTTSAAQLCDDLEAAYRLQKEVVETLASPPKPLMTSSDITGSGSNCPDGNCPEPERAPFWRRPGGNDGGGLFPNLQPQDPTQLIAGFFRSQGIGLESVGLLVIVTVVIILIFKKRQ